MDCKSPKRASKAVAAISTKDAAPAQEDVSIEDLEEEAYPSDDSTRTLQAWKLVLSEETRTKLIETLDIAEGNTVEPEEWENAVELGVHSNAEGDEASIDEWFETMCIDPPSETIEKSTLQPCRAPVLLEQTNRSEPLEVTAYYDPGSSANFVCEKIASQMLQNDSRPPDVEFHGAVEGKTGNMFFGQLSVPGSDKTVSPCFYTIPEDKWTFGPETGILLGLPGVSNMGTVMSINPDEFTIFHRNLGILHKIAQDGTLLHSRPVAHVASITREEMREDTLRNYVHGETVHPERSDW